MSNSILPIPYFHIDAFTDRVMAGNPAGVCLLDQWLSDDLMQGVAAENNLSETAYIVPKGNDFDLRWFTPTREVDLCGHATLAAAHVLFSHCGYPGGHIVFESRSGRLLVEREGSRLILDFPSRPATPCEPPADLLNGLRCEPGSVAKARDYLVVLDSADAVRKLQPDLSAFANLDSLGVIVTAPGDHCDFVSRFFAPQAGIPEDPVTGSAHCTLVPYWSERLGRARLHARQVSSRGGELFCELRGDRVMIGGLAVTYSTGVLKIPILD